MNITRCPYCGVKLGNFLYADACPQCGEELKQNTKPLVATRKSDQPRVDWWPMQLLHRVMRLVES